LTRKSATSGREADPEQRGNCEHWRWSLVQLRRGGFRLRRDAQLQRIHPDRLREVLKFGRAQIAHGEIEPRLLLGQTNGTGLGDTF
jgi:hypothetical protein